MPESFRLAFSPLMNDGFQQVSAEVEVGVQIDFEQQRIMFKLLPDELARARESILRHVRKLLDAQLPGVPVFNGCA